jgi:hypothetical protein
MNCKDCKRPMTWADQKTQYKRLSKLNYLHEVIVTILPRCSKCLTRYLKNVHV